MIAISVPALPRFPVFVFRTRPAFCFPDRETEAEKKDKRYRPEDEIGDIKGRCGEEEHGYHQKTGCYEQERRIF